MISFFKNICRFNQCGLEFASLYDLIYHIEAEHITNDSEHEKRFSLGQTRTLSQQSAPVVPLSYICRYFRTLPDDKPTPIVAESVSLVSKTSASANVSQNSFAHSPPTKKSRQPSLVSQHGLISSPWPSNVNFSATSDLGDDEAVSISNESISSETSIAEEIANIPTVTTSGSQGATTFNKFAVPTGSVDKSRYNNTYTLSDNPKHYKSGPVRPNQQRYGPSILPPQQAINTKTATHYKCAMCEKSYKSLSSFQNHQQQTKHCGSTIVQTSPLDRQHQAPPQQHMRANLAMARLIEQRQPSLGHHSPGMGGALKHSSASSMRVSPAHSPSPLLKYGTTVVGGGGGNRSGTSSPIPTPVNIQLTQPNSISPRQRPSAGFMSQQQQRSGMNPSPMRGRPHGSGTLLPNLTSMKRTASQAQMPAPSRSMKIPAVPPNSVAAGAGKTTKIQITGSLARQYTRGLGSMANVDTPPNLPANSPIEMSHAYAKQQ